VALEDPPETRTTLDSPPFLLALALEAPNEESEAERADEVLASAPPAHAKTSRRIRKEDERNK
jgi:hypothetical protein